MEKRISRYEYILLSLIIFTLPFNWFLKWESDSAFLRGIRIDYLLPKVYLQDILLFCLATYLLYSYRHLLVFRIKQKWTRHVASNNNHHNTNAHAVWFPNLAQAMSENLTLIACMSLVAVVGLRSVATHQASSFTSFLQLSSAAAFAYYIYKRFSLDRLLKLAWPPLVASAIMQSVIGIYQYIFQKSLVGYTLFGEIDLSLPGAIARESLFGALRMLPYGTLPHPNILAGFLGFASIIVWLEIRLVRQKTNIIILKYLVLGPYLFTCILTRSWVAISGLLLLYTTRIIASRCFYTLLIGLYTIVTIVYLLLPKWFNYQSLIETVNHSIIRRVELNQAGFSLFKDNVWLGTGLNQSLKPLHTTYSMLTPAEFIQPIHSIYLLWLVETGVIGASLTALLIASLSKRSLDRQHLVNSTHSASPQLHGGLWLIPLLFIAWLGIFDHYIVTIRQGQLLAALAIALTLSSANKSKK